ncbi:hypothetical protein F2P81_009540 [Scophthalmus maximus]|uniref:Uncharacterized protein n=1 Tax=Scophthalmus maximus TaxID=52904 RepID=A0A6A4SV02_SCOMX|nr:hypothetical protein F2P81_009540 [Scophthalmus maximus]
MKTTLPLLKSRIHVKCKQFLSCLRLKTENRSSQRQLREITTVFQGMPQPGRCAKRRGKAVRNGTGVSHSFVTPTVMSECQRGTSQVRTVTLTDAGTNQESKVKESIILPMPEILRLIRASTKAGVATDSNRSYTGRNLREPSPH